MVKKTGRKTEEKPVEESSKSSTPAKKKVSTSDYEKKVLELAETGLTSEKIGEKLRQGGIHSAEQSKTISQILKEKDKYQSPDLKNAEEKLEKLKTHYIKNKQDRRAMRDKDRIAAKVRKIKKYFKISK